MIEYIIWSNYHRMWWGPNRSGYANTIARAGRYTRDEALQIAASARDGWDFDGMPSEIPVLAADAEFCLNYSKSRREARR